MDKDKNQENQQPEQNELDLEFNQVEPITPKKPVDPQLSLLDKAKGIVAMFKSNNSQTSSQRQEPTLNNNDVVEQVNNGQVTSDNPEILPEQSENIPYSGENNFQEESSDKLQFNWKQPETWPFLQKLPQRHRRIVVVLFAFIILLLLFLWLKPSSTTVDAIHQQNQNSLPIEFQPLDQSLVIVEEQQPPLSNEIMINDHNAPLAITTAANIAASVEIPKQETLNETENNTTPVAPAPVTKAVNTTNKTNVASQEKPRANTATRQQTPARQTTQTNNKQQAQTSSSQRVPVVEASKTTASNNANKGNSKTLTINKGVSLMQVFRDNNLNISDVNAMTRANGAGNVLSSFKPGDKVQVSIQADGRVGELRLQDGSRFIRQTDGGYIYRK